MDTSAVYARLTAICEEITRGEYETAKAIFDLPRGGDGNPVDVLVEALAMMLVRIEAREFELSRTIAELTQIREELTWHKDRLARENSRLRAELRGKAGGIHPVAASPAMAQLMRHAERAALVDATLLITGETGTGKGVLARHIHALGPRAAKPFVAINCAAIPESLLESELFGYVRGAFTGASDSGRMGKFELANRGVIFLDEISSMSLYLQVKLLRVLQEKCFTRLGANRLIEVDVRVIAATNDNLQELIEQRMFRKDLFYRLNVIPLELPPLRERKEDIPLLAEHFLDRYCKRFGKPPLRLSAHILEIFQAYSWPGNIREFENCIEYMINMHEGGMMSPSLVPLKIRNARADAATHGARPASLSAPARPEETEADIVPLGELEANAIRNAIARFGSTSAGKQQAAKALGIGIATLYRKLREVSG